MPEPSVPSQVPIVDAEPDTAVIKAEVWTDGDHAASARAANIVPNVAPNAAHAVPAAPVATPVQATVSDASTASAASVSYDPAAHDTHAQADSRDAPVVEATPAEAPKPEEKPAEPAAPPPAEPDAAHAVENNSHPDDPNSGHDTPTDQNSDHG